jgi:hypothetical protein
MFNVETDFGFASASVNGKYMDAGRAGDIAGIEFSVDKMRVCDQPRESRHADAVLTLDCTPAVLLQMATAILTKLGLPAFNERQWRLIQAACSLAIANSLDNPDTVAELSAIAEQIKTATDTIAAL